MLSIVASTSPQYAMVYDENTDSEKENSLRYKYWD